MTLIIVTLIICIIIFFCATYHDKIVIILNKLDNIEEKINSTLIKRRTLLQESEDTIKEILNTNKQIYENLSDLNSSDISMMELDRKLLVCINEFYLIKDKYKKLQGNQSFENIAFAINETEDRLNAYKEYYNDIATEYNKLIKSFPQIIITFIKRRKEKEFFDKKSIKDSDYGDFKY